MSGFSICINGKLVDYAEGNSKALALMQGMKKNVDSVMQVQNWWIFGIMNCVEIVVTLGI